MAKALDKPTIISEINMRRIRAKNRMQKKHHREKKEAKKKLSVKEFFPKKSTATRIFLSNHAQENALCRQFY